MNPAIVVLVATLVTFLDFIRAHRHHQWPFEPANSNRSPAQLIQARIPYFFASLMAIMFSLVIKESDYVRDAAFGLLVGLIVIVLCIWLLAPRWPEQD